ncbi:MAG: peptidoglycan-binding domain-containing protein [Hyphomicrobiales bacterium]
MDTKSIPLNTLAKSAAAFAVTLGLAAHLTTTPAHAGKAAIYFGAGVFTGVVASEIARSNRGPDAGPPPRQRSAPPPRKRRSKPKPRRREPVAQRPRFNPAEVAKIQTALNTLGYDAGQVDGAMGRLTTTAIRGFQFEIDVKQTGVLTKAQKIVLFDRAAATDTETQSGETNQETTSSNGVSQNTQANTSQNQQPATTVSSKQGRIKVQKALNTLGYPTGTENGTMTAQTREAIKAFQLDISHEATGLLTADQRTVLFNDVAAITGGETTTGQQALNAAE